MVNFYRYYGVFVVEEPGDEFQPEIEDLTELYPDLEPFSESSSVNYYTTAAWNDEDQIPESFVVGNGSTTTALRRGESESYENVQLQRLTDYCIYAKVQILYESVSALTLSYTHCHT